MTQLTIIKETDLQSAGTVLETTKKWVTGYTKKRDALIVLAKKEGDKLTPATDQAINDFLAGVKKAAKAAEDARKPFTSKLNEVVGLFTAQENILKNDLVSELQNARNTSAAAYKKEALALQVKEKARLDKVKARIELYADAESQIRSQYAILLNGDKARLMEVYEGCTLEKYDSTLELFEMVVGTFTAEMWEGINAALPFNELGSTKHFTIDELSKICSEAKAGKFEKVAPHYQAEIQAYAQHLADLMPERKIELETGAANSAAAENLKLEQATAEATQTKLAEQRTEQNVQAQVSAVIIDSQIYKANISLKAPKTQTVDSYEIVVLERAGWSEIFKFFITHSDEQDLGKMKLDSMKLFAERKAKSEGLRIESQYIQYEEKYKAVNKSKKAA